MRAVPTPRSLAEVVSDRMGVLGIESARELSRRCDCGKDTARDVLSGKRPSVTEATLRKLADGLGLPIQVLRRAAGRGAGERSPFVVPESWDALSVAHRELLCRMAGALLQTAHPIWVEADPVAGIPTVGAQTRFAARHDHSDGGHVKPVFDDGT